MGELVMFPYSTRMKEVEAEMSLRDRITMRQLAERYTFLRHDDNIASIVDAREEQLMNTLGW